MSYQEVMALILVAIMSSRGTFPNWGNMADGGMSTFLNQKGGTIAIDKILGIGRSGIVVRIGEP